MGEQPISYGPVTPSATYSPWRDDVEFIRVYEAIRGHTLVDLYRCQELWSLVGQTAHIPGDILEVGVWRGGTGCLMAARAQLSKPSCKVFLCDTFSGVVKAGARDLHYQGGEHADTSVAIVADLIASLSLENTQLLQGVFPDETGAQINRRQFSLCHIDVDVYESALDVIEWVWPSLAVGGMAVYDDYGFESCTGVTRLVNERIGLPGTLTIHNLNGHAIVIKTA
jgi:O-methyltransferase